MDSKDKAHGRVLSTLSAHRDFFLGFTGTSLCSSAAGPGAGSSPQRLRRFLPSEGGGAASAPWIGGWKSYTQYTSVGIEQAQADWDVLTGHTSEVIFPARLGARGRKIAS